MNDALSITQEHVGEESGYCIYCNRGEMFTPLTPYFPKWTGTSVSIVHCLGSTFGFLHTEIVSTRIWGFTDTK